MYKKEILPDVTNFEENKKKKKNAGNRMGLRANQIKSLNKKTKTNTGFVIKALRGFTSTAAQKNPDKIPGCQICNRNSYQNDHHLGAVAEQ